MTKKHSIAWIIATVRLLLTVLVLLCAVPGEPAQAAEESAKLEADEVIFDYEGQRLTAAGNARVTYKELTITADAMEVDLEDNVLTARGHVTMAGQDDRIEVEELTFDLDSGDARLGPFAATFKDGQTGESLRLAGKGLLREEERITAFDLSLTTCTREHPHYHFSAKKIEYFPKDRIVLRGAIYWEGPLPLFYLPYLAISLKERANGFELPRLGYNDQEGLFLKLTYNFFVGDRQSGAILLDLMERKGVGEGLRYTWEYPTGAELTASIYRLDNIQTGGDDYHLQAGIVNAPLGGTKLRGQATYADQSLPGGGRGFTRQLGLQAAPAQGAGPQLTLNYQDTADPTAWNRGLDLAALATWRLWRDAQLTLNGRWYLGEGTSGQTYREYYDAVFAQNWSWGRLNILLRSQDLPQYRQSLLPQLTLAVPKIAAGWLGEYGLILDYQRREQQSASLNAQGQRWAADLARSRQRLASWGALALEAWGWAKARYYDTDEELYAMAPELVASVALGAGLRAEAGLSWTLVEGTPPPLFSADTLIPRGSLSLRGYYQRGTWQASLITGCALATGVWQPAAANLNWVSPNGDRLSLSTSYDMMSGAFGPTSLALAWRPKADWSLALNTAYDPAVGWTRLDGEVGLKQSLGQNVGVGLRARYDLFRDSWVQSLATLDLKWHCRTFTLGYDWVRGEYTLSVAINAFPQYPLKLAYGAGGLTFTPPVILP